MMLLLLLSFQLLPDEAVRLDAAWKNPITRNLIQAYTRGQIPVDQLMQQAFEQFPRISNRKVYRGPTLDDVGTPGILMLDFYAGKKVCEGPQTALWHEYSVPSYVSITYRRTTYDPSAEAWGGSELGINGQPVGVIYRGFVQRIWGHGFSLELETDPLRGVVQRVELVHFEEMDCDPGPLYAPCIAPKALYTFTWYVSDNSYQVRKANINWQMMAQMSDFYKPVEYFMVGGTPCLEMRNVDGLDAGFAEGRTRVWQTALPFFWAPCGDFIFADFYLKTQKRGSPWPGLGMPLLVYTEAEPTEDQRKRTAEDLEAARSQPTEMDLASGVDTTWLGADNHENLLDSRQFSVEMAREIDKKLKPYQESLYALGESMPNSFLGAFSRFALRELTNKDIFFVYDMDQVERRIQFLTTFTRWAHTQVMDYPTKGFSHHSIFAKSIDWDPPWKTRYYSQVLNHPRQMIPLLRSSDQEIKKQGELVSALVPTTDLINKNTDPNPESEWPGFDWPNTQNPDTYWSIYFTWR